MSSSANKAKSLGNGGRSVIKKHSIIRPFAGILCVLAGLTGISGCAFNRTVVNGQVQNFDTSFIVPGQTTMTEVLTRLGPPPASEAGGFGGDCLRYARCETRQTRLLFGYILFLPFEWSDTQAVDEYLITFNSGEIVTDVIHTRRDTIRPPVESEDARLPVQCTTLVPEGGAL